MRKNRSWYTATIILKCETDPHPLLLGEWSCQQSIHLIRAESREEAFAQAEELGKAQECSYLNSDGATVSWKYIGMENLEELTTKRLTGGMEIWGRIFHSSDPSALVCEKQNLSVYWNERMAGVTTAEILADGPETHLVCNRVSYQEDKV